MEDLTDFVILVITLLVFVLVLQQDNQCNRPPWIWSSYIPFKTTLDFGKDFRRFLSENASKYGPIYTARIGPHICHFIHDIHFATRMSLKPNIFGMNILRVMFNRIFGGNGAEDDSDGHSKFHDWAIKETNGPKLEILGQRFSYEYRKELKKRLDSDFKTINLFHFSNRVTFSSSTRAMFGTFDEWLDTDECFNNWYEFDQYFHILALGPYEWMVPTIRKNQRQMKDYLVSGKEEEQSNLVRDLLHDPNPPQDPKTLLYVTHWALNANSQPFLFWSIYFLLRNLPIKKELEEELAVVLKEDENWDDSSTKFPILSISTIKKLKKMSAFMKEVLRKQSTTMLFRTINEDTTITLTNGKEYFLKKGETIRIPSVHYDSDIFSEPLSFNLEHFAQDREFIDESGKKVFLPMMAFGYGKYQCSGRNFALIEVHPDADELPIDPKRYGFGAAALHPKYTEDDSIQMRIKLKKQFDD